MYGFGTGSTANRLKSQLPVLARLVFYCCLKRGRLTKFGYKASAKLLFPDFIALLALLRVRVLALLPLPNSPLDISRRLLILEFGYFLQLFQFKIVVEAEAERFYRFSVWVLNL